MSEFLITAGLALLFFCLAIAGLSIGLILKGRPIKRGTCGYDPTKQKDGDCEGQKNCSICGASAPPKEKSE